MPQRSWICLLILSFSLLGCAQYLSAAVNANGQQLIEIQPLRQCVYHAGDNLEWAAPELDDTTWERMSNRKYDPSQWRMWIRCHFHSDAIAGMTHPAAMVDVTGAYQVFADGHQIGSFGDLRTAWSRLDKEQIFPMPALHSGADLTFAFRMADIYCCRAPVVLVTGWRVVVGEQAALSASRDHSLIAKFHDYLPLMIAGTISTILGIVLWVAFWADRSRRDLALLATFCTMIGLSRLAGTFTPNNFLFNVGVTLPSTMVLVLGRLLDSYIVFIALFYFSFQQKRVPLLLKAAAVGVLLWCIPGALAYFLPPRISFAYHWFTDTFLFEFYRLLHVLLALGPLWAFLPWATVRKENRPIAWLSIPQSIAFISLTVSISLARMNPDAFALSLPAQRTTVTLLGSIISATMVVFLLRDQRKRNRERNFLAGEMHAAAEIQRVLVPRTLEVAPGLSIDAVYLPAQEVGGDFYLCRVLPDGTQRILLGDVSGKGAAAAMTAALLLGAAGQFERDSPSFLMARLNQTLRKGRISGFTTCICADVQPCGLAVLANAGHLTPYKQGVEIKLESGMPLGVAVDGGFPESRLQLEPGDTLTFLSDGVVEAQTVSGEMFGFDRTREISGQSARAIAEKAQSFGQADDITVLTVSRVK